MKTTCNYPIGKRGVPWGKEERREWLWTRRKNYYREYDLDTLWYSPTEDSGFHRVCYGLLTAPFYLEDEYDMGRRSYLLNAFVPNTFSSSGVGDHNYDDNNNNVRRQHQYSSSIVRHFFPDCQPTTNLERMESIAKPSILITGGVHGYETSGIKGALRFISSGLAETYSKHFNIVIVPCVSPWGYEMNERWSSKAIDPNRSFGRKSEANPNPIRTKESTQLMNWIDALGITTEDGVKHKPRWLCHLDLHETTNSDVTEFRPAKAARDGLLEYDDHIPDGFYLFGHSHDDDDDGNEKDSSGYCNINDGVTTTTNPDYHANDEQRQKQQHHLDFYRAILKRVEKVTPIAESESDGTLCGHAATIRGLLLLPCAELGICAGGAIPEAPYAVTTEVYPDSDRTTEEICVQAQVESICAALDFLLTVDCPR